jgi:hypothetical protein
LKTYFILPLFVLGRCAVAQTVSPLPVHSFTGTYSVKFNDVFSMLNNPAALVANRSFSAGVYALRRFMLPEPVQYVIAAGYPMRNAGLGVQLNYLKSGVYRQSELGIAYAKKLGKVDLGARVNYQSVAAGGYGNVTTVVLDLGTTWHVSDELHAGMHVYNPVGSMFSYRYSAGFGYEASPQVLLSLQVIKTEDLPAAINAALHYQPVEKVMLQAGIATATAEPFLAAGYQLKPWRLLLSVSYHSQLGCSPTLLFIYKSQRP